MKVAYGAGVGHHSPVAGYNAKKDMFLLLDTACSMCWIKADLLYLAMDT